MTRLFAGTPFDRPPTCERCDKLESECDCPPEPVEPVRIDPSKQTAKIRVEKRPRGKKVTVVSNLDPHGNDLPALAAQLKTACGVGGTVKDDGRIEIQGDHVPKIAEILTSIGYRTKES